MVFGLPRTLPRVRKVQSPPTMRMFMILGTLGSLSALALALNACENSPANVEADAAAPDEAAAADGADADCSYPPANNDAQCPSTYSYSNGGKPCSPVGLSCSYPGRGDGTAGHPCRSTAMLWCRADGGSDAGADAGSGTWRFAQ